MFECLSFSYIDVSCQISGVSAISMLILPILRLLAGMRYGDILHATICFTKNAIYSRCWTCLPETDQDQDQERATLSAARRIEMPDLSFTSINRLLDLNVLCTYFGIHGKPSLCISTASWKM